MIIISMQYFGSGGAASGKGGGGGASSGKSGGGAAKSEAEKQFEQRAVPSIKSTAESIQAELDVRSENSNFRHILEPRNVDASGKVVGFREAVVNKTTGGKTYTSKEVMLNAATLGGTLTKPKMFTRIGNGSWKQKRTIKTVIGS